MKAFVWVFFVWGVLEFLGSVRYLYQGCWPDRTRGSVAFSLLLWVAISAWAGYLLVGAKA